MSDYFNAIKGGLDQSARMIIPGYGAVKTLMGAPAAAQSTKDLFKSNESTSDYYTRLKPTGVGRAALPSLGRYDDIPAAQYPEGVSTGVGGGNAGPAQSQDPKGAAYIKPTGGSRLSREVPKGGASGTQTSPNGKSSAASPMDWAEYETFLNKRYGISFNNNRSGLQSNDLPSSSDAQVMGYGERDANHLAKGGTIETVIGGGKMTSTRLDDNSKPTGAQDPQSNAIDKGDQKRAIQDFGVGVNGADFSNDYGDDQMGMQGSAISARSRAFLDAPMGEGPMGVMRRTNASQGIMRVGDKYGVKGADGKVTEITQEGYDDIRQNNRNSTNLGQDYLKQYLSPVTTGDKATPKDAESPSAQNPAFATRMEGNNVPVQQLTTEQVGTQFDQMQGLKAGSPPESQGNTNYMAEPNTTGMDTPLMRFDDEDED